MLKKTKTPVKSFLPTLNKALLKDLVVWAYDEEYEIKNRIAKKYPEWPSHDQGAWAKQISNGVCETACCIAGNAVLQAGYLMVAQEKPFIDHMTGKRKVRMETSLAVKRPKRYRNKSAFITPEKYEALTGITYSELNDGDEFWISEVAKTELGLHDNEASGMFSGGNMAADIAARYVAACWVRGLNPALPKDVMKEAVKAYNGDIAYTYSFVASTHWSTDNPGDGLDYVSSGEYAKVYNDLLGLQRRVRNGYEVTYVKKTGLFQKF